MRQALAIFRKDARRGRAHIAIVAALTALIAILTPRHDPFYTQHTSGLNRGIDFLQLLVLPLAWWLSVAHAVHAEPLAGVRQFWITRPYSWRSLFAAKLLFCAAFLLAPLLVSDCYILYAMGFSPVRLFPALLPRALAIGAMLLLPAMLIAVLTRTTRRFILTAVGAAASLMLLLPIAATHPINYVMDALSGHTAPSRWALPLWGALALAFLLWVYAKRKIGGARILLAAAGAIVFVYSAAPSKAIAPAPPAPDRHPEIAVAFAPRNGVKDIQPGGRIQITLPLEFSGRDRDLLDWGLASVVVTPAEGPAWTSPWRYDVATSRQEPRDALELYPDSADYDRLSRGPVRVDAVLGVIVYDLVRRVTVPPGGRWTEVPGVGLARLRQEPPWTTVEWRVPLHYPAEKLTYHFRGPQTVEPIFGRFSMGHPDPQPFHLSPVQAWAAPVGLPVTAPLWSADVDVARQVDFLRRDLSIPAVRLSDWVISK